MAMLIFMDDNMKTSHTPGNYSDECMNFGSNFQIKIFKNVFIQMIIHTNNEGR